MVQQYEDSTINRTQPLSSSVEREWNQGVAITEDSPSQERQMATPAAQREWNPGFRKGRDARRGSCAPSSDRHPRDNSVSLCFAFSLASGGRLRTSHLPLCRGEWEVVSPHAPYPAARPTWQNSPPPPPHWARKSLRIVRFKSCRLNGM